jgi:hypothetical protein
MNVALPSARAARGKLGDVSQHLHAVGRSNVTFMSFVSFVVK